MEQFFHWQHCHSISKKPEYPVLPVLILIADATHNFLGGLSIGAIFLEDIALGWKAWIAAALHELPQELGDFAILVHSGYSKSRALILNFITGLTFLLGGLVAYSLSKNAEISFLIPFAAGNFLYISCADLIPEIKKTKSFRENCIHFLFFISGLVVMYLLL